MYEVIIEVVRKADYMTHRGGRQSVPFKTLKAYWLEKELCDDCKSKLKRAKATLLQTRYLTRNDICQKCKDTVYFHRNTI